MHYLNRTLTMLASFEDKILAQLTVSIFSKNLTVIKHRLPLGNLEIPSVQTTSCGKNYFVFSVIKTWNDIQKEIKGVMLNTFSLVKLKSLLIEFYLNMYKIS